MKKITLFILIMFNFNFTFAEKAQKNIPGKLIGDWVLNCDNENQKCIANQTIRIQEGAPIAMINVMHYDENTILELVLPLMMNLTRPVQVEIDNNIVLKYPYNICTQNACYVVINNDKQLLDKLKIGKVANVKTEGGDKRRFNFTFSLKGFAKSIEAIKYGLK